MELRYSGFPSIVFEVLDGIDCSTDTFSCTKFSNPVLSLVWLTILYQVLALDNVENILCWQSTIKLRSNFQWRKEI